FNRVAIAIEKTSGNLDREMAVLSDQLGSTLIEMDKFLKELNTQTPQMAASFQTSLDELHKTLRSFNEVANNANNVLAEDAPLVHQLNSTLLDVSRAAQAFRSMSETLDQQPESLLRGKRL